MFPHDAGDIGNIVSVTKICKDILQCCQVKLQCLTFLSNVEVDLAGRMKATNLIRTFQCTNTDYLQILKAFVTVAKKEEGFVFVTSST